MAPFDDLPGRASQRPGTWRWAFGPALAWIGLAHGNGELEHWPYLVGKYGLTFLWLLVPAALLHYPLNVEILRYTRTTGEDVVPGLRRVHFAVAAVAWLMAAAASLWIARLVSAGGAALGGLTHFPGGFTPHARALVWSYAVVAVVVAALVRAEHPSRVVEGAVVVVVPLTAFALCWACGHREVRAALPSFVAALAGPPGPSERAWDVTDSGALVTALTAVGVGGFFASWWSHWVRGPGPSMAADGTGRASHRRLGHDVSVALGGNLMTTLLACLLAYALASPRGVGGNGWDGSAVERALLDVEWGSVGRVVFLVVGAAAATCAWIVAADGLSRVYADVATRFVPAARRLGTRGTYASALAMVAAITCVVVPLDASRSLLRLSVLVGIAGTVVLPPALYVLNYRRAASAPPGALAAVRLMLAFVVSLLLAAAHAWATWPWW